MTDHVPLNGDAFENALRRAVGLPSATPETPVVGKLDAATVEQHRAERAEAASSESAPPTRPLDKVRDRKELARALRAAIASQHDHQ